MAQPRQAPASRRGGAPRARAPALAPALLLLLCCVLGVHTPPAAAHGIMTIPAARNWLNYLEKNYYWPDGLDAGGYSHVGQGGAVTYPNGKAGLCGDRADEKAPLWMAPGPVQATYKAGGTVEIHVMVTTNHYGRFNFRVCPPGATQQSECTLLQRADGKGPDWDLPKVAEGSRFNGGALGDNMRPMEVNPSFSWYKQPHVDCGYWKYCTRFEGTPVYKLRFVLPKDFTCERCILQWHYTTGHKCHPPCSKSSPYYPDCRRNPQFAGTYLSTMAYCGEPMSAYPEEFRNCADVKIAK